MPQIDLTIEMFHETVNRTMDGDEQAIRPMHLALPDGAEADVVLAVRLSPGWSHLIIQGLARTTTGRVVGEQHIQMLAPDPDWAVGHEHSYECDGFEYEGGRFLLPKFPRREDLGPLHMREHSFHMARLICSELLVTDPLADVFGPNENSLALRRARSLSGVDGEHQLLADATLRQALDERLSRVNG